jgi:hypothetical protein
LLLFFKKEDLAFLFFKYLPVSPGRGRHFTIRFRALAASSHAEANFQGGTRG